LEHVPVAKCEVCFHQWILSPGQSCPNCNAALIPLTQDDLDVGEEYDEDEATPLLAAIRGQTPMCEICQQPLVDGRAAHPLCIVTNAETVEGLTYDYVFHGTAPNYEEVKRLVHLVRHHGRESAALEKVIQTKHGEVILKDLFALTREGAAMVTDLFTVCGGTVANALYQAYEGMHGHGKKNKGGNVAVVAVETGIQFIPALGPFYAFVKGGGILIRDVSTTDSQRKVNKAKLCNLFLQVTESRKVFAEQVVRRAIEELGASHPQYSKQLDRYRKNLIRIDKAKATIQTWVDDNLGRGRIDSEEQPLLLQASGR